MSDDTHDTRLEKLSTFDEVLDAFGGPTNLSRMTHKRPSAMWNWRTRRGRFPSKFFKAMTDELARRGYRAPPQLWGQQPLVFRPGDRVVVKPRKRRRPNG
jgi:hypothetical protein